MDAKRQLTAEQRERISRNFKQAKIILDRKRSQMNVNGPSAPALPLASTPCTTSFATGQFALDNSTISSPDFRSPAVKKINSGPSPLGKLERKALTEVQSNTQRVRFVSRLPQDVRSISRDFFECASAPVMKENHYSSRQDENTFATLTVSSSAKLESTVVVPPEANAQLTGSNGQDCITDDLSQSFDEALLQQIDAICQQKSCSREFSLQTGNLPVPGMGTESGQDEFERLEDSSQIRTEGNAVMQGLPLLSAKLEPTVVVPPEANAQLTGSNGQDGITDGLSQSFDEALLQQIDAVCKQKSCSREFSLQTGNLPVPGMGTESVQDEFQRLEDSSQIRTEGNGVMQGLPLLSAMELKELSSTSPRDVLLRNEATPPESPTIIVPALEVFDGSQSTLAGNSNLESHMANSCGYLEPSSSAGLSILAEADPFTTGSVMPEQTVPPHLQKLNASQREAATSDTTKPLLILAGPGSGKTSTMVARLLTLMEEGVQPANILAMTFTTAAATEMRERVALAIGKVLSKELMITTFHSFCLQLCRSHADKLGRSSEFLIFGIGQQRKAVVEATRIALSELNAGEKTGRDKAVVQKGIDNPLIWKDKARKWQQFVAQAKCAGMTAEDCEEACNAIGAAILRNYEKTLAACDALDYHDFITFAVNLLKHHQEVLEECQKTWTCILVDEFQDTSTMQYTFLKLLASHNRITVVGDDDQSIFGFNGANSSGFELFRTDFPDLKEVKLHQNYRSTRCIVEAASALIKNNLKRHQSKQAFTDNKLGDKIEVKECRNEPAQCAFVADCILINCASSEGFSFGNTAVLYRRQVTGKQFQAAFRARKIPFNMHGVAFYRKKIIKAVTSLLWTVIPGKADVFAKRAFKALYCAEKSETKKVLAYVEKIARCNGWDFLQAAGEIFSAKISGTFTRRQLGVGKRVLASIRTLAHVVSKERSLSAVVTSAASLLPQRPIFDKRAVVTEDGGKFLNEDEDPRTVMEFLLDDVNDFLSNHFIPAIGGTSEIETESKSLGGSMYALRAFLYHLAGREEENFRGRRQDDKNSVTLTTMHQSKGLEWDTVFIVKANDTETPLLHHGQGDVSEASVSLEEERRLFYVAMTRARKKLYLTYVVVDSRKQVLQPSRFLNELPLHLLDFQDTTALQDKVVQSPTVGEHKLRTLKHHGVQLNAVSDSPGKETLTKTVLPVGEIIPHEYQLDRTKVSEDTAAGSSLGAAFLQRFNVESRSVVALLFHTWAKKPCFQDPSRLLSKVGFVIDERLRTKGTKNKDVLISLKGILNEEGALAYAKHVLMESSSEDSNSVVCPTPSIPVHHQHMDVSFHDSSNSSSSESDDECLEMGFLVLAVCVKAVEFHEILYSDSDEELGEGAEHEAIVKDMEMSDPKNTEEEIQQSVDPEVLAWEKLPAEERAALQADRQEHFQQQHSERSQAAAPVTPKQLLFLRRLGCTVEPTSRLHASRLIEQYKKL